MDIIQYKRCSKCKESKLILDFPQRKGASDGLASHCKVCNYRATRRWRIAHREHLKVYGKLWKAAHPGKCKEHRRKYDVEHREQSNEWHKKWKAKHPEKRKEFDRKWLIKHPEKVTEYNQRRLARKANAKGNGVTSKQWKEVKSSYCSLCAYCGQRRLLEMDHIVPLSKGGQHDIDNIAPACRPCNAHKSDSSLLMFLYRKVLTVCPVDGT